MRPILFSLGRLNFYSYGFFTALGFILGGVVVDYLARKKKLITKKQREYLLIDGLLFALIVAIVSARVGYILFYSFILRTESIAEASQLLSGGFIFYVGLAAGLAAFAWWIKRKEAAILPWLDVLIVGILVGNGFSEIGGYLNDNSIVHMAGWVGNWAVAGMSYAILVTEKRRGQTFWSGLFLLFLLNFFLGFWRVEEIIWFGLTLGQWASFVGLVGLSFLAFRSLQESL